MAAAGLGVKAAPFTYAAHALAAAAAVMVLVWCIHFRGGLALEADNKNLIFNVHPVLMLIGYIILGSEAIMIYKVFPTWSHDTAKLTHLILHAIATVLGAFGIYCAFKFHNDSGIANLYSLHSWLGIGTISLYGIQWVFGFVTFFFPGAAPSVRRGALFGLFVYVLALATVELGFLEKLTFLQSSGLDKYGVEAFLMNSLWHDIRREAEPWNTSGFFCVNQEYLIIGHCHVWMQPIMAIRTLAYVHIEVTCISLAKKENEKQITRV